MLGLKFLLKSINCNITKNIWNINVVITKSMFNIRFNAYGIDATGVEPRPDLIENATPKVIKNKQKM